MIKTHSALSTLFSISFTFIFLSAASGQAQKPAQPPAAPAHSPQEQDNFPPQLIEDLNAIKAAALADDYAYKRLSHLTENIGPRPSGSPQAQAAVEYVAAELRQLGLEVHLEEVTVPHWLRGAESAELIEYSGHVPGTSQKIVLTALGRSTATPAAGITAEVVVVNDFDQLQSLGRERVSGKIVLFNEIYDKRKAAAGLAFARSEEHTSELQSHLNIVCRLLLEKKNTHK